MKFTIRICSALLFTAAFNLALAQSYPVKPLRLVFPLVPGSVSNDILGRALAQRLSESLGQQVVADYRPGAAGTIGGAFAAKSAPDGYTLLIGYTSSIMISPTLLQGAGFNPVIDLAPIARFAVVPYLAIVHPSLPATNLKALVALAKARPGQINCASAGAGGLPLVVHEPLRPRQSVVVANWPARASCHPPARLCL